MAVFIGLLHGHAMGCRVAVPPGLAVGRCCVEPVSVTAERDSVAADGMMGRRVRVPAQYCNDPLDPEAEAQVLVTYSDGRPLPALASVLDGRGRDLLPVLSDTCIRILQLEIAVYHGLGDPFAWALHAVDVVAAPAHA